MPLNRGGPTTVSNQEAGYRPPSVPAAGSASADSVYTQQRIFSHHEGHKDHEDRNGTQSQISSLRDLRDLRGETILPLRYRCFTLMSLVPAERLRIMRACRPRVLSVEWFLDGRQVREISYL